MEISPELEDGTCWSSCRSPLKIPLSLYASLGLFLTVGVVMSVSIYHGQQSSPPKVFDGQTFEHQSKQLKKPAAVENNVTVCVTPGCVLAADELLKNMDKNIDPCTDFYSFACGGFEAKTVMSKEDTIVDPFSSIRRQVTEQLRVLIERPITKKEAEPFKLVKKYHRSCMNTTRTEKLGLEPLKKIIEKFGGWPVVMGDKWNDKNFVWDEMIYKLHRAGYPHDFFIGLNVKPDMKNSTLRVIDLDEASSGTLERLKMIKGKKRRSSKEESIDIYLEYGIDLAMLLGADKKSAREQMTEAYKFEMRVDRIKLTPEERRDESKLYNPMTIKELSAKVPGIPWLKYINNILAPYHVVTEKERVNVSVLDFFLKMADFLAKTPKRTLANYLMGRVSAISARYLNQAARNLDPIYNYRYPGSFERPARWKECTDLVVERFGVIVGAMYVRKYFQEEARHSANEMVEDIRSVFIETIDEIKWMDNKTRKHAKEKVSSMTAHIGYPIELLDDKKLEDLYDNLTLKSNNFLENAINLNIFETKESFKKLRESVNKTDWVSHGSSATVNALYDPSENSIRFPAGILRGVFFNKDRPAYLNYAAIGWVIGHEITHGLDDQGRLYCSQGNLVEWWEPSTKQNFLKLAKCIIEQYGNYSIPKLNMSVDGDYTQGENIADNGGMKQAYKAYIKWSNRQKNSSQKWDQVEQHLPNLTEYNVRQLFWLGAANIYCTKIRLEQLVFDMINYPHSPSHFRVQGTFANLPQFASDYNCPVGSGMNPVKKCSVW